MTNLAEHLDHFSHDTVNRYLKGESFSPHLLFEQVEELLERDSGAYLIFDDTVLEKGFGPEIEHTHYQWSGNAKQVIRGIGVVSLVYVNSKTEHFWVIDYRIFDMTPMARQSPSTSGRCWGW